MRKCYVFRLFRLRKLLMLAIIMITLYLVKMLIEQPSSDMTIAGQMADDMSIVASYFVPKSLKKIDWHNYKQIKHEEERRGIGEQGVPASLPKEDAELEQRLFAENGFNGALSDKIPLNRSLPDIRHPKCKSKLYIEDLPTVSVVVPFHNEHWSTLLRTAHSVLYRSPEHLIKEIFLVDDASTKEFLKQELEDYLAAHMPKVRVVRLASRSGLIAARLAGARLARGDVLVFLDSHTEPNVNWLPPLLEPLAASWRTVVCPYIDVVAYDTFEYRAQDEGARGAFDWEFFYKRLPLLPRDLLNMPEPFENPVMAGGLFAISRAFFWELGGYDPGLDIWGGEQYELSFKIWQCGGRMLDAPCSRVGHIYRKFAPFPNPHHGDFVDKNYRRVAEVWMDEYAQYLYARRPRCLHVPPGDLAPQRALRDKLRCKPFRWFITQIAFDLTDKYPPVEPQPYATGRIRPQADARMCVDAGGAGPQAALRVRACDGATDALFKFSWHKDIRLSSRNLCWDLPQTSPASPVLLYSCHLGGGNQLWRYLPDTKQIVHGESAVCAAYSAPERVVAAPCAPDPRQRWLLDRLHVRELARWAAERARVTGPLERYP